MEKRSIVDHVTDVAVEAIRDQQRLCAAAREGDQDTVNTIIDGLVTDMARGLRTQFGPSTAIQMFVNAIMTVVEESGADPMPALIQLSERVAESKPHVDA